MQALRGGGLRTPRGAQPAPLPDVWRSEDAGRSWLPAPGRPAPWCARSWFGATALPNGDLLLSGGVDAQDRILCDVWRSSDAGMTWDRLAEPAWPARCGHDVAVLPNGVLLLAGGFGEDRYGRREPLNDVWQSADGGVTWELWGVGLPWSPRGDHALAALPNGEVLVLGGQASVSGGCSADIWSLDLRTVLAAVHVRLQGARASQVPTGALGASLGKLLPTAKPRAPLDTCYSVQSYDRRSCLDTEGVHAPGRVAWGASLGTLRPTAKVRAPLDDYAEVRPYGEDSANEAESAATVRGGLGLPSAGVAKAQIFPPIGVLEGPGSVVDEGCGMPLLLALGQRFSSALAFSGLTALSAAVVLRASESPVATPLGTGLTASEVDAAKVVA